MITSFDSRLHVWRQVHLAMSLLLRHHGIAHIDTVASYLQRQSRHCW